MKRISLIIIMLLLAATSILAGSMVRYCVVQDGAETIIQGSDGSQINYVVNPMNNSILLFKIYTPRGGMRDGTSKDMSLLIRILHKYANTADCYSSKVRFRE